MAMPAGIRDTGVDTADFDRRLAEMVGQALRDGCTPTNPRVADANALTELYAGRGPAAPFRATDNKNWRTLPMAHYSLTPRVNVLAKRLLSQKAPCAPNMPRRSTPLMAISRASRAVKPARRFYELMRQLPVCISADELIVATRPVNRTAPSFTMKARPVARRRSSFSNLNGDLDSPDYKLIIEKGVLAIRHQLEEKTRSLGSAVSRSGMDEVNGCRAAIYACDGLLTLATNLANSAETLAAGESNAYRRANYATAPPFCTRFRPTRRAILKKPARPFICSSSRCSSITAAMR
ncbi:bifunctional acetaldehyde-CoA/alcohol dehydrogenase [Raoultella terrigena]|uniref:Bifunctional acetaldehyde-CoA/alcohol dehydrogenase n=1 Tax=Raoultella terrigena TaxID=577 RepID=A0A3P8J7A3_RAOTE|nr:bifunctional acetaldehyde-CoA/alcohol dehydrogenase [Raoultella terrigena]